MKNTLQVLIVDDDPSYSSFIFSVLDGFANVDIVGKAASGPIALSILRRKPVDVVLLDLMMPEMDGIEVLIKIRKAYPDISVIMMSGKFTFETDEVVKTLELGALDFIAKGSATGGSVLKELRLRLTTIFGLIQNRINMGQMTQACSTPPKTTEHQLQPTAAAEKSKLFTAPTKPFQPAMGKTSAPSSKGIGQNIIKPIVHLQRISVIAVGTSTGGPNALLTVIPQLPADLDVPILLVQHMPPKMTASLAASLDAKSKLKVKEGEDREEILPNVVYVAPGGRHMVVKKKKSIDQLSTIKYIVLTDDPPENSVRPAADVLFRSVAEVYEGNIMALIMTGMGSDGAKGVKAMKDVGCYCLNQSRDTCVVYGMPMAIEQNGLADETLDLDDIPLRIQTIVKGNIPK